jgi:hypothetical protein
MVVRESASCGSQRDIYHQRDIWPAKIESHTHTSRAGRDKIGCNYFLALGPRMDHLESFYSNALIKQNATLQWFDFFLLLRLNLDKKNKNQSKGGRTSPTPHTQKKRP